MQSDSSEADATRAGPVRTAMDMLTAPFRGDALVVNLVFALGLGILFFFMSQAGPFALFGLPAILILVPWFLKYCLVVGRHAAYGRRETPSMTLRDLNPFELQPIGLAVGLALVHQALAWILGPGAALIGLALVAPPAIAVLVLEERVLRALNPVVLLRCVTGLGLAYPVLAALLGAGLWLCVLAIGSAPGTLATVFALQSVLIATFHGTGRLLHARADTLGYGRLETPAERQADRAARTARREFEATISEAYRHAETGRPERALDTLLVQVRAQGDNPDHYATVLERLLDWHHPTVAPAFARHYVDRLYCLGRHAEALQVFLQAFDREPVVRPIGEEATLYLARQAREAHRDDVALALVSDFDERFPESRFQAVALLEHARLLFTERDDAEAAAGILGHLEHTHPQLMERDDVRRLWAHVRTVLQG